MKHIPTFLTGMTVWIDGVGLLGTAKTITLPKIEKNRETTTQGGFERSVDTGIFKAMECELEFSELHSSTYKAIAKNNPTFVAKGSIKHKIVNKAVVLTVKGGIDVDDGNFETGNEVTQKVKVFCDFYQLEIAGEKLVMLDVENMIAEINGVDYLDTVRKQIL